METTFFFTTLKNKLFLFSQNCEIKSFFSNKQTKQTVKIKWIYLLFPAINIYVIVSFISDGSLKCNQEKNHQPSTKMVEYMVLNNISAILWH